MAVVFSGGNPTTVHRTTEISPGRGSISFYGGQVQTFAELYRRQPNLRLVCRFLGRNLAQLPLHGFERVADDDRQRITDGPLGDWLECPDVVSPIPVTRYRWIDALVQDLALYDVFLAVKMRNEATGRLSTVRIPPSHFFPKGDSWLWPEQFRVFGNNGWKDYSADEVVYLHGYDPENPKIGSPSAEALRRTLAEDHAAGYSREQMWNNAGRQAGFIKRPGPPTPKWSDEARERFEREFHAKWAGSGPGAGGTPILEEGMEYVAAAFSAKELEYLGARRLTREECAAQYFIPPVFVGILENANFANVREQHRGLYSDTLGPWMEWVTTDLKVQLLPDLAAPARSYFEFRIEAKLEGSFEEQAAAMQTATGAPWLLRSEARSMRNLPPVDGFDEPIVPLNVLIGGQASPTDSAPPPGLAHRHAHGTKARARYLLGWEAKHREIMVGFFTRQKNAVLSRLGAGAELADAFDSDRWNTELRNDLLGLSLAMAEDVGGALATDAGAEFDPALVEGWLAENARLAAEGINSTTLVALETAYAGVNRTGTASRPSNAKRTVNQALRDAGLEVDDEGDEIDPLGSNVDPAAAVFDVAIGARAIQIATSRTTTVGSFSRDEGAKQAGLRTKTWNSSGSPNSRHGDLDGETVAIGETFSNGGLWPGDPALGIDETAGCECSIDFGT